MPIELAVPPAFSKVNRASCEDLNLTMVDICIGLKWLEKGQTDEEVLAYNNK